MTRERVPGVSYVVRLRDLGGIRPIPEWRPISWAECLQCGAAEPYTTADAAEVEQMKRAFGHLLHPNPPASTMLTEEYQARLKALSRALGGEPVRSMWLSGGPRDGWHLSGQRGGDFALPETKDCHTWHDALTSAEKWVAKP